MKEEIEDKISIIVSCYNLEKCIEKCLDSIKKQTYTNLEILLINDGSKDKTEDIIKAYIKNDARFQYFYKENGGASDARNYGLKRTTGEYICFIDGDDYIEPTYVEELYRAIKNDNTEIAICGFKRIYTNKETYEKMNEDIVDLCIRPAPWNKMYHKSLFLDNQIEFPVKKWYEDLSATSKLIFMSDKQYSIVEKPLYNYIQNSSSIMHTYDDRIFDVYEILEEIEEFTKEKNIYEKYKANIEFMHIYHILIGTTYRASFHKNFSKKMISDIIDKVESKYPNWKKNPYLKKQKIVYKIYCGILSQKTCGMLYFILKHFAKYMYL